jgi:hypothetical protein
MVSACVRPRRRSGPLKNADLEDAETGPSLTALIRAQGKLIALIVNLLESGGALSAKEFAAKLGLFAVVVGESAPEEGEILAFWAAVARDHAEPTLPLHD